MANRDMLTELYARHYLDEMIHECQNRDFCGSLIVVDIDEFKQVNDTFGHQRGDKILKQVSKDREDNDTAQRYSSPLGR